MKTAHQARLETEKYHVCASDLHTRNCISSIEGSIDRAIKMGYYEAPVDMYTSEALDHFIALEYTFRNGPLTLMISWEHR